MTVGSPRVGGCSVLVVDDHPLVAQLLCRALSDEGVAVETIDGSTTESVLDRCRSLQPSLVMLDLDLGRTRCSGDELIRPLQACGAQVLVLTATTDPIRLGACLAAGAIGVATKDEPLDALIDRVKRVLDGDEGSNVTQRAALVEQWRLASAREAKRLAPFRQLTPSEQAVLAGLVAGASLEAIAMDRGVSLATVRSQVRAILQKLGVGTKLEAVTAARRAGWVPRAVVQI